MNLVRSWGYSFPPEALSITVAASFAAVLTAATIFELRRRTSAVLTAPAIAPTIRPMMKDTIRSNIARPAQRLNSNRSRLRPDRVLLSQTFECEVYDVARSDGGESCLACECD